MRPFVSATCGGEVCKCGAPAEHKVGEEIAFDDPRPMRHNLTAYVCHACFVKIMGPAADKWRVMEDGSFHG